MLSGFLVYRKIHAIDFSIWRNIADFYAGRILRLAPTYLLVIVTTGIAIYVLGLQSLFSNYVRDALSSAMFLSNVRFWKFLGNYWGEHDSFLLHTWSLSVEEQWYLCLPVALLFIPRRRHAHILIILGSMSLVGFLLLTVKGSTASFYLLGTRMWEFIAGAALVVIPEVRNRIKPSISVIGCIAISILYFLPLPNVISVLLACLISLLVIAAETFLTTNWNPVLRALMQVGRMAYPIYLWHWPIDVMFKFVLPFSGMSVLQRGICEITVSLILGVITSRFIEFPFRYEKRALIPICSLYAILVGVLVLSMDLHIPPHQVFVEPDAVGKRISISQLDERLIPRVLGLPSTMRVDRILLKHGATLHGIGTKNVLIIGDSHTTSWAKTLIDYFHPIAKSTTVWCAAGISPLIQIPVVRNQHPSFLSPTEKFEYDNDRLLLIKSRKVDVLVMVGYWDSLDSGLLYSNLREYSLYCRQVIVIGQAPVLVDLKLPAYEYLVQREQLRQGMPSKQYAEAVQTTNSDKVQSACDRVSNCVYLPTRSVLSLGKNALISDSGEVLYIDEDHLSDAGAKYVMAKLRETYLDPKFR